MTRTSKVKFTAGCLALLLLPLFATAQESTGQQAPAEKAAAPARKPGSVTYRLEFAVVQAQGEKKTNSRSYSVQVREGSSGRLRTSLRLPVQVEPGKLQFHDLGMSVDATLIGEWDGMPHLSVNAELTTLLGADAKPAAEALPVHRRISWSASGAVRPDTPTVLASVDELEGTNRYQLVVTATRLQ